MPVNDMQGGYAATSALGYAGMEAEGLMVRDAASRQITTAVVAFGLVVGRGATDGTARLGGTGYEGITVADKTRAADQYAVGEMAAVLRKGSIWVTASTNVGPADPVTYTAATGVIGAGLAATITGAKFETTATSGNLVRVYLG